MTDSEKDGAIGSLFFLTQKRDGSIKGRAVADGRDLRESTPKEEAASPTPQLESVLLTSVIDAQEGRDVRTMDVPNAFIQADQEDKVIMKLKGKLAELLIKTDPQLYRKYIIYEKGITVLYVTLLKALYGTLKAALLFYKKFIKDISKLGFKLNPYDPCIANRIINKKQHTIVWHVDDIKSSHVDSKVNDKFEQWVKETYEEKGIGKVKVTRGKIHDYLGMTLDFSTPGQVKITMIDYIEKMLKDFQELQDIGAITATPAADHLFNVRDNCKKLTEYEAQHFHNMTARALFLSKRSRQDLQTVVAFLSTRVREPDEDDWKKLLRMIKYLKGTVDLPLILRANGTGIVKWWVDAAYAVHRDMKGHTGGTLQLGKGSINSKSIKQKLNTTSSTESELVGTFDVMPDILWTNYFLKAQGYGVKDTIIYQDNKSAILLEKNGKMSSTKCTKHINVRYFFIKDRYDNKEIDIKYCPTDELIADFFTKPLQGKKFIKFRDALMGSQ